MIYISTDNYRKSLKIPKG